MSMIFFTYRAPMEARRGASILSAAGIPGKLSKTPAQLATKGCGYGIRVQKAQGYAASLELRGRGCPYERSFLLGEGPATEVEL